jgi:threonine dehydratase
MHTLENTLCHPYVPPLPSYHTSILTLNSQAETATIYCPPFDHPDIWSGNSTCMHEIAQQMPSQSAPDVLICSVGGGGLINGICQAMDDLNMHSTTVLAMETAGAESLNKRRVWDVRVSRTKPSSLGSAVM